MGMSIGMVAPAFVPVPPSGYGGVEWIVDAVVRGMVARGHEVVLVGSGDSTTPATRLHSCYDQAQATRMGEALPELVHASFAYTTDVVDCDVIHDHTIGGPAIASARGLRVLHTVHGPPGGEVGRYYGGLRGVSFVAISEAQRRSAPSLAWTATVPNAVDVDACPYREDKSGHLAFLGRMNPDKGVVQAIELARRLDRPLLIAAKLRETREREYFAAEVEPRLGGAVEYVGELGTADKYELLAGAAALAFPLQWDEPFGMAMIEALACGTPVLALNRGAVPEIVDHGVTGIVARDVDELVAVSAACLPRLRPQDCRAAARARFDVSGLVDAYEGLYARWASTGPLGLVAS